MLLTNNASPALLNQLAQTYSPNSSLALCPARYRFNSPFTLQHAGVPAELLYRPSVQRGVQTYPL
jgi:hypothetical protein